MVRFFLLALQVHVSNALGCVNPVEEIAAVAHAAGAKVLVDGCQSVPNMPVDVQVILTLVLLPNWSGSKLRVR